MAIRGGIALNVNLFPRLMGNPHQSLARTPEDFIKFIRQNNSLNPCFTSHNSYPEVDNNVIPNPLSVLYQCTPFDFDQPEEGLENALNDVRKLVKYWGEVGVPSKAIFSGGHGFHNYPQWVLTKVDVSSVSKAQGLKRIIRAIQVHAVKTLNLKTMDGRIIGDFRRLMRIPGTKWVGYRRTPLGERTISNGRYCFRLTPEQLALPLPSILSLSKSPPRFAGAEVKPRFTFLEYIQEQGIDIAAYEGLGGNIEGTYAPVRDVPDGLMKQLIWKPCINMDLTTPDPRHVSRMNAVIYLMQVGYSEQAIVNFILGISNKYGWTDGANLGVTSYQTHQIVNRRPAYKGSTCATLKREGLCIGPTCHLYFKSEGEQDAPRVT